jgi:hypothetical protein
MSPLQCVEIPLSAEPVLPFLVEDSETVAALRKLERPAEALQVRPRHPVVDEYQGGSKAAAGTWSHDGAP